MDFCSNKLLILILKLFILLALFAFSDTLTDNIFRRLCNNSAEVLGLERNINRFSNLCTFAKLKRIINQNICILILNFFNNIFANINFDFFFFRIYITENNILIIKVFTLCGNNNCTRNLFIKIFCRKTFLFFKHSYCFKKFLAHFSYQPFCIKIVLKIIYIKIIKLNIRGFFFIK
ncbi:hypothetical protein IMSAG250_01040 [Clostridiales bacterium]|nr:hypothetical protein IMSAG250_01040 [Clostridiales bacterium]